MNQLPKNSAYRSSIEFGSDGIIAKDFKTQAEEEEPKSFAYKGSLAMAQGRLSTKLSGVNPFSVVHEETEGFGLMKEDEVKDKRKAAKVRTMKEQIYMLQDRRKRVSFIPLFLLDPG